MACGKWTGADSKDARQAARQAGRSKKTVTEHINLLTDASCVPLARLDRAHRGE